MDHTIIIINQYVLRLDNAHISVSRIRGKSNLQICSSEKLGFDFYV